MRIYTEDIVQHDGKEIELKGWVDTRRDHGKLIFIDLRDAKGIAQVVFPPHDKELVEQAGHLRPEWVVCVRGTVQKRPANMENKNVSNGAYEISASGIEILSESKTPPFSVTSDGREIGEDGRMRYRYLDLRRSRMQKNIRARSNVNAVMRNFLNSKNFVEIETPILGKSTPEGARDYLVPSRLQTGLWYALPQAPQQYKQLLMASGMERYYQIARCFRDEDTRGDRQPEFTQLDLEMSFVEREDVMAINEELLIHIVKTLYPEKKIQEIPFPRMTYREAMERYGNDRPDLRKEKDDPHSLAFSWIVDFPFFEKNNEGGWTFTHNPFSAPKSQYMDDLLKQKNIGEILTSQYDIVLNGWEIGGGSIRNHRPEALRAVLSIMGFSEEKIENHFGHMLQAFEYGTPPHGGIAWGLDRLLMILENEPNIREVIAFPKTGDGRDLLMNAPSEVSKEQLEELRIEVKKSTKKHP